MLPEVIDPPRIEAALQALEELLGYPVTVIDNAWFFTRRGVFEPLRRSHRQSALCAAVFSTGCVDHCRHTMNARSLRERRPFTAACPAGLTQLVVPLRSANIHYGMLYLGPWQPGHAPDRVRLDALTRVTETFAAGLMSQLAQAGLLAEAPDERGAQIAAFLHANAGRPIGLADVAGHIGLSRSRTSEYIRQRFGCTFLQMLHWERIELARALLTDTSQTLRPIARQCGFSDEFHLSRTFKQVTGLSPSRYRSALSVSQTASLGQPDRFLSRRHDNSG